MFSVFSLLRKSLEKKSKGVMMKIEKLAVGEIMPEKVNLKEAVNSLTELFEYKRSATLTIR